MKLRSKLPIMFSVLALALLSGSGSASAWAPEGSATIHPGVMTFTGGSSFLGGAGQCTANFVFTDASGQCLSGPGRTLLVDRQQHRNERVLDQIAARWHADLRGRPRQRRYPERHPRRHPRLQLVDRDAAGARDRRRHLRIQRPCADQDRSRPRSRTSIRPSRSGADRTASRRAQHRWANASSPTATRSFAAV